MLFPPRFQGGLSCNDVYREKEKLASQLEQSAADANANLVQIENAMSSIAEELKKKRSEIKGSWRTYRVQLKFIKYGISPHDRNCARLAI